MHPVVVAAAESDDVIRVQRVTATRAHQRLMPVELAGARHPEHKIGGTTAVTVTGTSGSHSRTTESDPVSRPAGRDAAGAAQTGTASQR